MTAAAALHAVAVVSAMVALAGIACQVARDVTEGLGAWLERRLNG